MNFFKSIIPDKYKKAIKDNLGVPSLTWSLHNLKKKGYYPKRVIDIGAYKGNWTKDFIEVFPKSEILMIEAQKNRAPFLEAICKSKKNIHYYIALVASTDDEKLFFLENETGSQANRFPLEGAEEIASKTIDTILKLNNFESAEFIKMDIQGYELEALKGSVKSLENAEFCLLEVTLFDIGNSGPLFSEAVRFMESKNFQVYDICQFMRRPYDKTLFQMDVLFIKKSSSFIKEQRWN